MSDGHFGCFFRQILGNNIKNVVLIENTRTEAHASLYKCTGICAGSLNLCCSQTQRMDVRGMIKNFFAPCTSNLQGNALSPSLFEISYPFKIGGLLLVPQVLVYCFYDAFTASILCTTKLVFQFWEQKVSYQEKRGMRKDFKSTFSRSSHFNL